MTARDSGISHLGAIGIEGQRMTGNDFMLSAMETHKSQVSVPTWFETEKPALVDHLDDCDEESEGFQLPRRGSINGSENFLTGMEYFASAQYVIITLMCFISCIPMALHGVYTCLTHIISTACNFAEAHKSGTAALIIILSHGSILGRSDSSMLQLPIPCILADA